MNAVPKVLWLVAALAGFGALGGCAGSDRDDLQAWMAEQRALVKPTVTPIVAPKKFTPQAYTQEGGVEPFNIAKLTQALRRDAAQPSTSGLIAPELSRRKEALESFPLDAMEMVGSLQGSGQPVALVRVDKLIYQVRAGNYLGLNYGRVLRVGENQLTLREIVQDASGEWIERPAALELQEKSK
ncbi:MAG: pilus assembly protein PilP [Variovorax sp.]|jgi:type IV pilus assembly protein PilP|nr:MAG: pilus assembly protein PilP [Variovorax sp.]